MPRKKKSAAEFRLELAIFIASLGEGEERRIRNALRQYKTLFEQKRRGKKPLTAEENQSLAQGCALHDNYLLGKHLDELQKKLSKAEKREANDAAVSASMAFISSTDSSNAATNGDSNLASAAASFNTATVTAAATATNSRAVDVDTANSRAAAATANIRATSSHAPDTDDDIVAHTSATAPSTTTATAASAVRPELSSRATTTTTSNKTTTVFGSSRATLTDAISGQFAQPASNIPSLLASMTFSHNQCQSDCCPPAATRERHHTAITNPIAAGEKLRELLPIDTSLEDFLRYQISKNDDIYDLSGDSVLAVAAECLKCIGGHLHTEFGWEKIFTICARKGCYSFFFQKDYSVSECLECSNDDSRFEVSNNLSDTNVPTNENPLTPRHDNSIQLPICVSKTSEDGDCVVCCQPLFCGEDDSPIIIDDSRYGWSHLHCWNARHPSFTKIYQVIDTAGEDSMSIFSHALESSSPIMVGWDTLNCTDRWRVLHYIFDYNVHPLTVTMGHVLRHFPCRDCTACQTPIICSWCPVGCDHPTMPTQLCTRRDCTNVVHHLCQTTCETENCLIEEPRRCIECHTQARVLIQPTPLPTPPATQLPSSPPLSPQPPQPPPRLRPITATQPRTRPQTRSLTSRRTRYNYSDNGQTGRERYCEPVPNTNTFGESRDLIIFVFYYPLLVSLFSHKSLYIYFFRLIKMLQLQTHSVRR